MSDQDAKSWPAHPVQQSVTQALDRVFGDRDRQQQTHNAELAHVRAEAERLSREWPAYHQAAMQRQQAAAGEQVAAYQQQMMAVQHQLAQAHTTAAQLAAEKAAREAQERQLAERAEVIAAGHRSRTFLRLALGFGLGWLGWRVLFVRGEARAAG